MATSGSASFSTLFARFLPQLGQNLSSLPAISSSSSTLSLNQGETENKAETDRSAPSSAGFRVPLTVPSYNPLPDTASADASANASTSETMGISSTSSRLPRLSAKYPRLLRHPGFSCDCSRHEFDWARGTSVNMIHGYRLECLNCHWTPTALCSLQSSLELPSEHPHLPFKPQPARYQLCESCYEKGWQWYQHRRDHTFQCFPPPSESESVSESESSLLGLPPPANHRMDPTQLQPARFGRPEKPTALYHYADDVTQVAVASTFEELVLSDARDVILGVFDSGVLFFQSSVAERCNFVQSLLKKDKKKPPTMALDEIGSYQPNLSLWITSILPLIARLHRLNQSKKLAQLAPSTHGIETTAKRELTRSDYEIKDQSSPAIGFVLFDQLANQVDESWYAKPPQSFDQIAACCEESPDVSFPVSMLGGSLIVPARARKAFLPLNQRQSVFADGFLMGRPLHEGCFYRQDSRFHYSPAAMNLRPIQLSDFVRWIEWHLSVEGKKAFDLDSMLQLVKPFESHSQLLYRMELLFTGFCHAFDRRFRELSTSPSRLLQYGSQLQALFALTGLHGPLEGLNLNLCETRLSVLEKVLEEWKNLPGVLEAEDKALVAWKVEWQEILRNPDHCFRSNIFMNPSPSRSLKSQARRGNDCLYQPVPSASASLAASPRVDDMSTAQSIANDEPRRQLNSAPYQMPMLQPRTLDSVLSLLSRADVGTKYVVSTCFPEIVLNPKRNVLVLFFGFEDQLYSLYSTNLTCYYTPIILSMITTLQRLVQKARREIEKEESLVFSIFPIGLASSSTGGYDHRLNQMDENWMAPEDFVDIVKARQCFVLYPAGDKPKYDTWDFYRKFPWRNSAVSDEALKCSGPHGKSFLDYYCEDNLLRHQSFEESISFTRLIDWLDERCKGWCGPSGVDLLPAVEAGPNLNVLLRTALYHYRLCFEFVKLGLLDPKVAAKSSMIQVNQDIIHHLPPIALIEEMDLEFFNSAKVNRFRQVIEQSRAKGMLQHEQDQHQTLEKQQRRMESKKRMSETSSKSISNQRSKLGRKASAIGEDAIDDFDDYVLVPTEKKQKEISRVLSRMDSSIRNRWFNADIIPLAARLTVFVEAKNPGPRTTNESSKEGLVWALIIEICCINGDIFQPDILLEICQSEFLLKGPAVADTSELDRGEDVESDSQLLSNGTEPYVAIDDVEDEPLFVNPAASNIRIRNELGSIEHNRQWYQERGVLLPASLDLSEPRNPVIPVEYLYAALLHDHRQGMMLSATERAARFGRAGKSLSILLELDDWYHGPVDLIGSKEFKPSSIPTFQFLAQSIVEADSAIYSSAVSRAEIPTPNISQIRSWHPAWFQ